MLKKEALNRVFAGIIEKQFVTAMEARGFKFKKSGLQFSKVVNGYTVYLKFGMPLSPVVGVSQQELLVLEGGFYISVIHEKFKKWFGEQFAPLNIAAAVWSNFNSKEFSKNGLFPWHAYADFSEFQPTDFFEPSKAYAFKHNVSVALAGGAQPLGPEVPFAADFLVHNLDPILDEAIPSCADTRMLDLLKSHRNGFDHCAFLLYLGQKEAAKTAFTVFHGLLKTKIENKDFETWENEERCQAVLKAFIQHGKALLDLDLSVAEKPQNISVNLGSQLALNNTLTFKENFSIAKSPNGIHNYHVNEKGETIVAHTNDDLVTIWDKTGALLASLRIEHLEKLKVVGYLEDHDLFCFNNHFITRNFEVKQLAPPDGNAGWCTRPVYLPEERQWVVQFSVDRKGNEVRFYNDALELVKALPLPGSILEVIPTRKLIITCKYQEGFTVYDFDGNKLATLESNNAMPEHPQFRLRHHSFSRSHNYLFSYFYYAKSQLFRLSDWSMKPLWGHPTYEKGYKELLYNNVNHNFGVSVADFSPDERYLVAGACHGKYVAWKLPGLERVELIPDAAYVSKMTGAEVVTLGNKAYLKNRNYPMTNIQFWENGQYFSFQVHEDTLLFNDRFEHIQTLEKSGEVRSFGRFATTFKEEVLTVYER